MIDLQQPEWILPIRTRGQHRGPLPGYVSGAATLKIADGFFFDPVEGELLFDVEISAQAPRKGCDESMQLARLKPLAWDLYRDVWTYWFIQHALTMLNLRRMQFWDLPNDNGLPAVVSGRFWDDMWGVAFPHNEARRWLRVVCWDDGTVSEAAIANRLSRFPPQETVVYTKKRSLTEKCSDMLDLTVITADPNDDWGTYGVYPPPRNGDTSLDRDPEAAFLFCSGWGEEAYDLAHKAVRKGCHLEKVDDHGVTFPRLEVPR